MDINLCFIEGISRTDTPYFYSKGAQDDYFDSHKVVTIETTFYPPHFKNVIRCSSEDVSLSTQVNYIFFEYQNKRFYYFIDDIEYISEDLLDLYITMDVIQTYMYEAYIEHGVLERKLIKRWNNDGTINRDYIRENVSEGNFKTINKTYLFDNTKQYWMVIKCKYVEITYGGSTNFKQHYGNALFHNSNGDFTSNFVYQFMPLGNTVSYYKAADMDTKQPIQGLRVLNITSANIVDAWIIDYNPFPTLFWISGDTLCSSLDKRHSMMITGKVMPWISQVEYGGEYAIFQEFPISVRSDNFTIGNFEKNTYPYRSFDAKYCPVLLDENYYRAVIGSTSNSATYPLRHMPTNVLYYSIEGCITDGTYVYRTGDVTYTPETNHYNTAVIDTNIIYGDLLGDAYSEYVANNRNRWGSVALQVANEGLESIVTMATGYGFMKSGINAVRTNPKNWDRRTTKNPRLKQKAVEEQNRIYNSGVMKATSDIPLLEMFMPSMNQVMTDINYMMKPPSVKQIGNFQSIIQSRSRDIFKEIQCVRDLEQCARYFEMNGYIVNEFISPAALGNIMVGYDIRYHFNILKFKECDITLLDVIQDNITCENIKERLLDGIRYWNTHNNSEIGSFYYDNTENDFVPNT